MGPTVGLLLCCIADASSASETAASAVAFGEQEYIHRWSEGDQHEFTPLGQEDLESWTEMLTINVHPDVGDGQELAATANAVLARFKAHGRIVKVDSKRRTLRRPAQHLIIAILIAPDLLEAVFARLMLVDDTGVAIVASHRIYGPRAGDAMSAWIAANGPEWEERLMSWKALPPLDSLGFSADDGAAATLFMASLRTHLDIVRSSPPPSKSQPGSLGDASVLAGLSRGDLRRGLGEPSRCRSADPRVSFAPPCDLAEQWVFNFYRLPPRSRGGGLELVIRFSSENVSTSSEWRRTQ